MDPGTWTRIWRSLRRLAGDDAGVTLIELVIASSILFIAAMGVISALSFVALSTGQTAVRTRALNMANQRLEQARNVPYDSVGIRYANGSYGDPAGTIPATTTVGEFDVRTEVSWASDPVSGRSEYKNIKITISWTRPLAGSLSVASAVYGKSALTNIGDMNVTVKEYGTDNRIQFAQVNVTPFGGVAQRTVWTDVSGVAFFGGLPIGLTPVRIAAAGWLFDDTAVTTPTIQPDLVTPIVVYGYRPCTAAITVVDTAGTPIADATVTLADSRGRTRTLSAVASGVYYFSDLIPDTWQVTVTAPGRASATAVVGPMVSGGAYTLTVALTQYVPPGSLRVRVRTASGAMIPGASVAVTGPTPGTGAIAGSPKSTPTGGSTSGEVFFTGVASGLYTITVTKTGYQTTTITATVVGGVEYLATVTMPSTASSTGSIAVRVERSNGQARSGWTVWVRGASGDVSGVTDSDGRITFTDLPAGSYEVSSSSGNRQTSQTVQVTGGQTSQVTLVPN